MTTLKKASIHIFRLLLLLAGIWLFAAAPMLLRIPEIPGIIFRISIILLFIAGFRDKHYHIMLALCELFSLLFFLPLTPQLQFRDREFMRQFAVKPAINYLSDGKFEVIRLRNNRYRTVDDYDENYQNVSFDPAKVSAMDIAMVYWDNQSLVAHTMLNFKFTDGKNLALSVEPRTPVDSDREPLTCLNKQQELLIILGTPEDLFDLRIKYRKEDLYLYQTNFTPAECRIILEDIIAKVDRLDKNPEFYDLIRANCITAVYPALQKAAPQLKYELRVLFNGLFDRMLFENKILKHNDKESFESLKSRSLTAGKIQGKL